MSIAFDDGRWAVVKESHRRWWAGELERPLLYFRIPGRDPRRPCPDLPLHGFAAFYDPSVSAEAIVDRWDYELSCYDYLGDAFPTMWINFGPGVLAAFLGGTLETQPPTNTVWFHSSRPGGLAEIDFRYDPDNVWLRRIRDIGRAAMERWRGLVQVGMTDLGGILDVLATFRPGAGLLLDLYDHPDDVKRLTWQLHEFWWRACDDINAVLQPVHPGYTGWAPIYSEKSSYMLQCDFAYMLGPDQFEAFVRPELAASCARLPHAFYHLDGPGQLAHLDSLLSLPELRGIQWMPGAGNPTLDSSENMKHWPDVYRRIRKAGRLVQIQGHVAVLDTVAEQVGSARGIVHVATDTNEDEARDALRRYGAA